LADLISRSGSYVPSWILEFYATVWINPYYSEIAFSFLGQRVDTSSEWAREILRIPHNANKIHKLCFPDAEPPRRAHTRVLPPVEDMRPCFRGDFGEGSIRIPTDMTSIARALDSIVRRTILPREGFREGFTRLQQWIVSHSHLVRRVEFDIWDLMLLDIEDVIYGSFSSTRHMHFVHWLTYLIFMGASPLPPAAVQ
jgi:hypothetical protein